jgi:GT2 family glycosyltransferase
LKIDIIVCTYNRPERILNLVKSLRGCIPDSSSIIVVDSSDEKNLVLRNELKLNYITSSHKNQPYQRCLGTSCSNADYILFLDDDMEVYDPNFLSEIQSFLERDKLIAGLAINFEDSNAINSLSKIPTTQLKISNNFLKKSLNWFKATPDLEDGDFGFCGQRGKQPKMGEKTKWVSGGAFVAKRKVLLLNFNFQLLDLFGQKLGMGEDAIFGFGLSKHGSLYYLPKLLFLHNDTSVSNYSQNIAGLSYRTLFSRLYLSAERQRLNSASIIVAYIHFHYYAFFRVLGYFFNLILDPSNARFQVLKGTLKGWSKVFFFKFSYSSKINNYWKSEISKDILINKGVENVV